MADATAFLQIKNELKTNLPYIIFELTSDCNLKCRYCYNIWKRPGAADIRNNSYKQARKTLKQLFRIADIENITFTGGEPFMSERFAEIVLYARMKKKTVTIISNGTYATREDYKMMIDLGVNLFELPMHSCIPAEHDFMAGMKGAWNKALQSISDIKQMGGYLVAVIVLTKVNYKNIRETLLHIKSLGIKQIMLNRYNIGGTGISEAANLLMTKEEMKETFRIADKTAGEEGLSVTSNVCTPFCVLNPDDYPNIPISSCSASVANKPITLDLLGNLRICNHSPVNIGNIFDTGFEQLFETPYVKSWEKLVPEYCKSCELWENCRGGCRAASEQLGKTIAEVDPLVLN